MRIKGFAWVMVGLWRWGFGFDTGCWGRIVFMFVLCAGLGKSRLIKILRLMNLMFALRV